MKNILVIMLIAVTIASCKSKKDVISQEEKEMVSEQATDPGQGATRGDGNALPNRPRRKAIDPEMLVAQLGLDEEKEEEFLRFWEASEENFKALREESKGDRSGMREGMQKLRKDRTEGLAKILSPEQMTKYQEIMKAQNRSRANKGKRRGGRG